MNYPLHFRFKLLALAPQIFVEDSGRQTVCYVKQKLFKLKEKVNVFRNDAMNDLLATIEADRIIDWSAKYTFRDAQGRDLGAVGRRGMRSLWSAHYDIFTPGGGDVAFTIREENPMAKVVDSLLGDVPIVGLLTGYICHPKYIACRADGTPVMRMTKMPSFLERSFQLDLVGTADEGEQAAIMMSFLMMVLLERERG